MAPTTTAVISFILKLCYVLLCSCALTENKLQVSFGTYVQGIAYGNHTILECLYFLSYFLLLYNHLPYTPFKVFQTPHSPHKIPVFLLVLVRLIGGLKGCN